MPAGVNGCARDMGIPFDAAACWRKKNRFLFYIGERNIDPPAVVDDGVWALPPQKGARPSLTFKETECQHLTETIYFPSKPDWKPISLTLYDIRNTNPVFDWIKLCYDPTPAGQAAWFPSVGNKFKKTASLYIYDGCGVQIESWIFENAWPQVAEWGDLDMSNSEVITVDVTLRYDRAYIIGVGGPGGAPPGAGAAGALASTGGAAIPLANGGGGGGGTNPTTGGFFPTAFAGPANMPSTGAPRSSGNTTTISVGGGLSFAANANGGVIVNGIQSDGSRGTAPTVTYVKRNGQLVPVIGGAMVAKPSKKHYPTTPVVIS
jgi:hypothetical protein